MINYSLIANAISYYESLGYMELEVPWFVSRQSMEVTSPPDRRYCTSFLGDLVASGEQSFIEMMRTGLLEPGFHQCATPCFRDEPTVNKIWRNYFFKVELIVFQPGDFSVNTMIEDAKRLFESLGLERLQIIDTDIGKDIMCKGVEIGSYGYRQFEENGVKYSWVYGTGLAEPRFSLAQELVVCDILKEGV
jgi:seryl-tRNA synthetase